MSDTTRRCWCTGHAYGLKEPSLSCTAAEYWDGEADKLGGVSAASVTTKPQAVLYSQCKTAGL